MQFRFDSELFINAIDLSPYIVGVSETGNVIGIKAPPELVAQMFLVLRLQESKAIIFYSGKLLRWTSLRDDTLRGWVEFEIIEKATVHFNHRYKLWLRFDE